MSDLVTNDQHTEYIDSISYKEWSANILNLYDVSFDLTAKVLASRKLRYCEIDIEVERDGGKIAPDELYIPIHVIDTNIRREQSSYVQFITQSPRAVILKDLDDESFDLSILEADLTTKLRYPGWQGAEFANIDGFQSHGYGIKETVQDLSQPGEIAREYVQLGDFCFVADTRDIKKCELVARCYYFTRTQLVEFQKSGAGEGWDSRQLQKMIDAQPNDEQSNIFSGTATLNRSLYKVMKVMFKVKGIVHVAWCGPKLADDWLRKPRKLFLGRRKLRPDVSAKWQGYQQQKAQHSQALGLAAQGQTNQAPLPPTPQPPEIDEKHMQQIQAGLPPSDEEYETRYPYTLFPYLISEDNTVACLKGRIFLDQDTQSGASSLLSSTITAARRSSGLYFSKDTTDPNDDFLMQKNVFFKTGALINGKVSQFQLTGPSPQMFQAIQMLISMNQQETSQVNFAETNRQADSRKTAKAIEASQQQSSQLTGVQVTLYSNALREEYTYECEIIKSRVAAGLIKVSPTLQQMYARNWEVKPAGDIDVVEKQKMVETMQQSWPVVQQTGAASIFLSDLLEKLFPESAAKYIQAIQQAQQAQQQAQQGQQQHVNDTLQELVHEIMHLGDHPEYFSDTGQRHAYPRIEVAANNFKSIMKQHSGGQKNAQPQ